MGQLSIDISAARDEQLALRQRIKLHDDFGKLTTVAGVDVGFPDAKTALAAVAVLSYPELEVLETRTARSPTQFPYVPGYLSFREIPAISAVLEQVEHRIDMLVCDGQGYAHPRRCGLACHLGVTQDIPCLGVAKSRLVGTYREPGWRRGCCCQLRDDGEQIGSVLRTRDRTKPVFVSPGHRVGFESSVRIALSLCPRFRLPETTRVADRLTKGGNW